MSFVNPYTFVPLGKGTPAYRAKGNEVKDGDSPATDERRYTGVLNCTLTTETPLSIPDKAAARESMPVPFFRVGGELAIPGSSIRGCVRSVYEMLTDSCLRTNERHLHSVSAKKAPGLLMWGSEYRRDERGNPLKGADGKLLPVMTVLKLVEAERVRVTKESLVRAGRSFKYQDGEKVCFTGSRKDPKRQYVTRRVESMGKSGDKEEGYFLHVHTLYSGSEHNHPSLFMQAASKVEVIDDATLACLRENVELYVENSADSLEIAKKDSDQEALELAEDNLAAAREYRDRLEEFLKRKNRNDRFPVWFSREKVGGKNTYQLAPSQLSRSVYPQTPKSLAGSRAQCTSVTELCPACELFGFVSPQGGGARAGRVRFSDAMVESGKAEVFTATLATLLDPRQSSFEFYLRNESKGHEHSFTPTTSGTELAGRKAYWHHQSKGDWKNTGEVTEFTLNTELVPSGTTFGFRVYVDGVTSCELNRLVYALTYGQWWGQDGSRRQYLHKIGHGKPIGLGSVLIEVNAVALRETEGPSGTYTYDVQSFVGSDTKARVPWYMERDAVEDGLSSVKAIKAVANFCAIPANKPISYPVSETGDIFKWFAGNRDRAMSGTGGGAAVKYKVVLPKLVGSGEEHEIEDDDADRGGQDLGRVPRHGGKVPQGGDRTRASERRGGYRGGQTRDSGSLRQWAIGEKAQGIIDNYVDKGFGFIRCDGRPNLFFHISAWSYRDVTPERGMEVSFEVIENKAGNNRGKPCASRVTLIRD